jgi:hypothetical protein
MPPVLTSIGAFKQSLTGGSFEALAATTGDSLSIIAFDSPANAYVEEIFSGNSAHKMEVAVFSPRFGDNQSGLRLQHMFNPTLSGADGDPQLLMPRELDIPVYSTDLLNVQVNGTASDNANVVLQLYYENINGAGQRLATWEQVEPLIAQTNQNAQQSRVLGIEVTVTPGTTGNYGTAVALNANDDRLQADFDYALLGFSTDQPTTSIGIKGPDTGFYRIPMPGHWDSRITADWFIAQAKWRGTPHIPIINANNKATTFLDGLSSANAGATKVSLILAQLSSRFVG